MFRTEQARALYTGSAVHAIMPPGRPLTSAFGALFGALGMSSGWPVARGGSGAITDALVSVLRAHGQTGLAALAAAAAGAVVVWLLGGYTGGFAWETIVTALITCAVAAAVMAPVYVVALKLLRFPELDDALRPVVSRVPALGRLLRVG